MAAAAAYGGLRHRPAPSPGQVHRRCRCPSIPTCTWWWSVRPVHDHGLLPPAPSRCRCSWSISARPRPDTLDAAYLFQPELLLRSGPRLSRVPTCTDGQRQKPMSGSPTCNTAMWSNTRWAWCRPWPCPIPMARAGKCAAPGCRSPKSKGHRDRLFQSGRSQSRCWGWKIWPV